MMRFCAFALPLLFLAGCSDAGEPLSYQQNMELLERSNFRGRVSMASGGSPATWTMKQTFGIGPENAHFSFDGEVDFSASDTTQ